MKGKVVIITGASSGIGLALVRQCAEQGCRIVMAARNESKLTELVQELKEKNVEAIAVKADVSDEEDCKKIIRTAVDNFSTVDVLINNAGISMRAIFEELDLNVMRSLMNTNFWGTVYCSKYALPYLLKSKGSVVGVSSIAGYMGLPGRTGYSASKFAMHGFLETLRTETLYQGLHVLIACPGFTASNIRNSALAKDGSQQGESPRKEEKMMSAEEVAERIMKSVKKRKRTLVMTSTGKMSVLLRKFFPAFIDKQAYKMMKNEPDSPLK
ncbi:MAG: SDR family oxidoreductase [Bacteroidota bacterium]